MTDRINAGSLRVDKKLYDFINDEALPGTGVSADDFWSGFDRVVHALSPRNRELLAKRDDLQRQIDAWYQETRDQPIDLADYKAVLREIGYLVPEGDDFTVCTANVDPEISTIAGPQLVVPVTNARYALNAANARWGSLYDALYGTDAISGSDGAERAGDYNPVRGARVIARGREFLDAAAPLAVGSHADATSTAPSPSRWTTKASRRSPDRRRWPGIKAMPPGLPPSCWRTMGSTSTSSSTATTWWVVTTPPGSGTSCLNRQRPRS